MKKFFSVENLDILVDEISIIENVSFKIGIGKIHVLMGANGSGKSTLVKAIMGDPSYKISNGNIIFEDEIINKLPPDKRAKKGLFLAFQNPIEIPGVNIAIFLHSAYKERLNSNISIFEFIKNLRSLARDVGLKTSIFERNINENFSGGEKKKMQLLESLLFKPKLSIFDEIDAGVDVDSLDIITKKINEMKKNKLSSLLITHSTRLINKLDIDKIIIMKNGKIVKTGGMELISLIEKKGFKNV